MLFRYLKGDIKLGDFTLGLSLVGFEGTLRLPEYAFRLFHFDSYTLNMWLMVQ
jgi:hypothetical protein